MKRLDKYFPPAGKCALCGFHDKRHRLWDAIIGNYDAGDSVKDIAYAYVLPVKAIKLVVKSRPYQKVEK